MIAEHVAFGNTDARFMGLEIILVEELDRMRRHQRQAQLAGQVGCGLNDGFLLRLPVALHLKIKGAGENGFPGLGPLAGQFKITVDQGFADIAEMRTGQGDQATAAEFGKPFSADFSPVAPPFDQIGLGQQFAQLLIAGPVAHQQQQAAGVIRRLRIGDPDIGTGNRLDALATSPGVKLDEAEQVAEVSQGHRRHAIAGGTLDGVADADDAVGD